MKGHEGGHHRTSFDTFGGPTPEGSEFSSEGGSDETLPFELIALEIALEMVYVTRSKSNPIKSNAKVNRNWKS